MSALDPSRKRDRKVLAFVAGVTAAAVFLTASLVAVAGDQWWSGTDWVIFALFGTLLFLAETQPSFTMRFGDNGAVSPGWTFAYALVLFGMSIGALGILLVANTIVGLQSRRPVRIVVFNLAQIAAALSSGALVLHFFGFRESMGSIDAIPLTWGIGIFVSACTVLVLNGLLTAIVIGLHTGTGFITTLRTGLALTMSADAALLSLAPVFVIAIDFSLLLVPVLASTSYIVIQSARKSLQRAHQANHDPLTDLLNRRAFDDRVSRTIGLFGSEPDATLLVMDFDRFKEINDSLGHAVGDSLLVGFAERLSENLPPTASAARLGGDEFAVVIPGRRPQGEALQLTETLHRELTKPYDIDGFPLSISVSIGVAVAPSDGTNAEDLLAAADLAMYRAKQFGSRVVFHQTAGSAATGPGRIGLLSDLGSAIEQQQLTNFYQPQISFSTGRIDTVEALVRWQHPVHGLILPNDFIGMAEQTDLIDALTDDVLARSMCDLLLLDDDGISLAVNVSARTLHRRTFAPGIIATAETAGFPIERLELEITERALASDPDRIALTLAQLREAGVRIAIDDFGTGYSSFASLRQIRADRLKIDRGFTAHVGTAPEDRLVVKTITDLGHGLGLDVVAEGVETLEILAEIESLGCDFAQGYAIARPMPIQQLQMVVQARHHRDQVEVPA
ncbi:MAG: EAL domain-containing protein [Ilumatobacter sp.]|uniref:putative bifunctional diguanylate cyclase/phosphodiesterase n=1 Tax=Ilumatobacter sp. TaxID=1967498 RepID=UPI00261EF988|nr:EAL domain-containing protein [Ilumatobacter sp.]MDJ0770996.1 EAL domain-containing protein [Ilumatobacter sp.]